jgi:hypothetical protein
MASPVITHSVVTGAATNPDVLVDGVAWDATHTVTGLENVANVDTTNATNITSGTLPAARIGTNSITNAMAAQMATATIKGNATTGTANASDLSASQVAGVIGCWGNNRLAKTGTYSVANADKGQTIALGGSSCYTLTFGAASSFDANFAVLVLNEDTARGKIMSIPGITAFTLYPLQSIVVYASNNVWQVFGRSRWQMPPMQNFYVNPSLGNDANDGLAAGDGNARATLQSMFNEIFAAVDFSGNQATINLAAGTTETGGVHFSAHALVGGQGGAALKIDGGAGATISTTSTSALGFFEGVKVQISNLTLITTTGGDCVTAGLGGSVEVLTGVTFGACAGSHMNANGAGAVILLTSNYTVSGNATTAHIIATGGGQVNVNGITGVTVSANITVAYFVLTSNFCGANLAGITYTLGGHTVTGKRYEADNFSMINSGGGGATYFPGSVAGTTSGGGTYI